jgi:hypothetical protein
MRRVLRAALVSQEERKMLKITTTELLRMLKEGNRAEDVILQAIERLEGHQRGHIERLNEVRKLEAELNHLRKMSTADDEYDIRVRQHSMTQNLLDTTRKMRMHIHEKDEILMQAYTVLNAVLSGDQSSKNFLKSTDILAHTADKLKKNIESKTWEKEDEKEKY